MATVPSWSGAPAPTVVTTSPFASSYVAVEQFNPTRYYNEVGMTPSSLPTGTTGAPTTVAPPAPLGMYVPFVLIALVIWALERHKFKLFGQPK